MKRHLTSRGTTPDELRREFGLWRDHPMVAVRYAAQRSELAKSLGLGRLRYRSAEKAGSEPRCWNGPPVTGETLWLAHRATRNSTYGPGSTVAVERENG